MKKTVPRFYLGAFKVGHRTIDKPFIDETLSIQLLNKIFASKIKNPPTLPETATKYEQFTNLYSDKESIKALEFLTQFNNEYYSARAPKAKEVMFNTPELNKIRNDMSNAKRRDIMSREYNFLASLDTDANNIETDTPPISLTEKQRKALF